MSQSPKKLELISGEYLFRENDEAQSLFIVGHGTISISKRNCFGKQIELARLRDGEVIGELSFFDRAARSASAVATVDTEITEIPFDAMEKALHGMPNYVRTIISAMAERLRKADERIRRMDEQIHPDDDARRKSEEPNTAAEQDDISKVLDSVAQMESSATAATSQDKTSDPGKKKS